MPTYSFQIAELSFQVRTAWPVTLSANFLPFMLPSDSPWQERMDHICVEEFPALSEPVCWDHGLGETTLDGQRCLLHRLSDASEPYLMEIWRPGYDRLFCYRRASNELPLSMKKVFNGIMMEELFLRKDALILHSSFIRWNGLGILFSAPSGTGKSTQADLWARYEGAEILNGDRAGLRKIDGQWTAFGLPFAGSSDIFRNESAPISTIVMLEQGPENRLVPLTTAQAFRKILPEVFLHRWDARFMDRGINLLLELLAATPVYLLSCRPDRGAVELLRDAIIHHPEVKL